MFLKPPPPKFDMLTTIARVPGGSSGSVRCTYKQNMQIHGRAGFSRPSLCAAELGAGALGKRRLPHSSG
jgi:hypothetical protein